MAAVDIGELRGIITLNDQFSGPIDNVAKALGVSSESFRAVAGFAGLAAGAIATAAGAIAVLGVQGSHVATMRSSFDELTGSIGETSASMLDAVRTGTSGLISDMAIMEATNKAVLLGLPVTASSMGDLAQAAVVLGRAMGQDASKSIDDMTTALGRSSPMILDNLGLSVRVGEANDEYAKSLGKTADQLSDSEKKQAFYNAAMDAARAKVAELGGAQLTFGDRVDQARVLVGNFVDSLGAAIATSPVVAAGMDTIMRAVQSAFGGNQQATVQTLMGFVNSFAIGLVQFAQVAVQAASVAVQGFYAIRAGFNTVLEIFYTGVTRAADLVADLASKGADLPGVGDALQAVADGARGIADTAQASALGFAALATDAGASSNTASAAFGVVNTALDDMKTAMEAAASQSGTLSGAQETTAGAVAAIGSAAEVSAQQYEGMATRINDADAEIVRLAEEAATTQTDLQQTITQASLTGSAQRLQQIDFEKQQELMALQTKYAEYPLVYEELAAMVNEKFRLMGDAARGFHADVVVQAGIAGFRTRDEMEESARVALDTYTRMKDSGKFTYSELERAHKEYKDKEKLLNETSAISAMQQFDLIANASKTLLRGIFGSSKTGAIATAIIDTAQAVVKALASAPPPLNYGLAAAVGAAGLIQINKIRSTEASFAQGTGEGGRFRDFGRATSAELHGVEAVVNLSGADSIADVVVGKMGEIDSRTTAAVERLRADMRDQARRLPLELLAASRLAAA